MFFFKLMFLKKKKKLDNKGAALANVLLITTFVMVITSSVLSMAYNTYRMKLINVSSKDNLYACEAVLEQVRVGFRNQFSEITDSYSELTSDNIAEAFETFYADYQLDNSYIVSTPNSVSGDNGKGVYFYDIVKVAELLTSISGTGNATVIVDETNATTNLDYDEGTPVFTSSVDITVNDSDYENIKVTLQANATGKNNFELTETYVIFHDMTVIYSENGYESEVTTDITIEFPEVGTTTVTTSNGEKGGWVTLDDRMHTYSYWTTAFSNGEYPDNDFYAAYVSYQYDDAVYINTTDYPANTVTYVIFDLKRYYIYEATAKDEQTQEIYIDHYTYEAIYPFVQTQKGEGLGQQYSACQLDKYDNVQIYIGGDETDDSSWVDFAKVFDSSLNIRDTEEAAKYLAYYDDDNTNGQDIAVDDIDNVVNPDVKYKVHLMDLTDYVEKCRGWIAITGGVYGDSNGDIIQPVNQDTAKIYVNIPDEYYEPEYYFSTSEYGYTRTTSVTKGQGQGYIFFDLRGTNYSVGDKLKITLKNIDVEKVMDSGSWFTINMRAGYLFDYSSDTLYEGTHYYGALYIDDNYTVVTYYDDATKTYADYMDIYITMEWETYPFISIFYLSSYSTEETVTLTTEWESGSGTTTTTTTGTTSDAVIYYEDWRKE